ncbi:hypothetical protein ACWGNN_25350 [Streptomyces sp. NPDC055817]
MTSDSAVSQLQQVPDLGTLSDPQVRGQACVWCAVILCAKTAVDLGPRDAQFHGTAARWFPRGCRPCSVQAAYLLLLEHTQCCEQCEDDPALCEDGRSLRGRLREVRR